MRPMDKNESFLIYYKCTLTYQGPSNTYLLIFLTILTTQTTLKNWSECNYFKY